MIDRLIPERHSDSRADLCQTDEFFRNELNKWLNLGPIAFVAFLTALEPVQDLTILDI